MRGAMRPMGDSTPCGLDKQKQNICRETNVLLLLPNTDKKVKNQGESEEKVNLILKTAH